MKFKVGDRVKVKKGLIADASYGGTYFREHMRYLEGREFTIGEIRDATGIITLKEEDWYNWDETMLEMYSPIKEIIRSIRKKRGE